MPPKIYVEFRGERLTLRQIAERLGLKENTVYNRWRRTSIPLDSPKWHWPGRYGKRRS